jgi:hypothetical protein
MNDETIRRRDVQVMAAVAVVEGDRAAIFGDVLVVAAGQLV